MGPCPMFLKTSWGLRPNAPPPLYVRATSCSVLCSIHRRLRIRLVVGSHLRIQTLGRWFFGAVIGQVGSCPFKKLSCQYVPPSNEPSVSVQAPIGGIPDLIPL